MRQITPLSEASFIPPISIRIIGEKVIQTDRRLQTVLPGMQNQKNNGKSTENKKKKAGSPNARKGESMAKINIPQYEIFKIGTNKLKYYDWDLQITRKEAFRFQELVSLFEAQEFRIMANKILHTNIAEIDFSKIFMQVVLDKKSDFSRAASNKGITVNGINYRRFVGTTGGLKNNTLLFCNSQYIDTLNELCECKRNRNIPLVPAKYEAYKALTCSASQPICIPDGI